VAATDIDTQWRAAAAAAESEIFASVEMSSGRPVHSRVVEIGTRATCQQTH